MTKFAAVAVIPLFAGFLYAQDQPAQSEQSTTRTETRTTTNTWNGTLLDANCRTTHTEHNSSSTSSPDENTTRTETTHTTTNSVDCPVTTTTTTFGFMTPDGQFMRFDDASNTRIIGMVKSNKQWTKYIAGREPLKVRVVGRPDGDTVVLESIQ
jgi:hypothetical protein